MCKNRYVVGVSEIQQSALNFNKAYMNGYIFSDSASYLGWLTVSVIYCEVMSRPLSSET